MNRTIVCLAIAALSGAAAHAQSPSPLARVAQSALETSPEVSARFNALRAAVEDIDVVKGGYYPRIDLTAEAGRTEDRFTNRTPQDQSLNRTGVALTITQMLWDGMATRKEAGRLGHTRMTRYFEFVDASEQTALEATRAYYDVQRYRKLVGLAEDNYVQHKYAFEQIQSRVRAGVGRGVDLEQAGARLALAESNLVTERANMHDVTERYRRVVGETPPRDMPAAPNWAKTMPADAGAAINQAAAGSPSVIAAIENLRAARALAESRKSSYQPTLEARIRSGVGNNLDGSIDQRRDTTAQLLLSWNLFNGGSDQARDRSLARQIEQAADLRDKACRDVRQTTSIAFNDTRKLTEQLAYLERNVLAIEKARDAYRQQFDIGQRSLLDLLNAENELYTAKRAYVGTEVDLGVASVRTFAAMGALVPSLGLSRADAKDLADTQGWEAGSDGAARCPLEPTQLDSTSRTDLDQRARALVVAAPPLATAAPAASPSKPATSAEPALRLRDWAAAWSARDMDRYLSFYSPTFKATSMTRAAWEGKRRQIITGASNVSVQVDQVQSHALDATHVETAFQQTYDSSGFKDKTQKVLVWERQDGTWRIVSESNR